MVCINCSNFVVFLLFFFVFSCIFCFSSCSFIHFLSSLYSQSLQVEVLITLIFLGLPCWTWTLSQSLCIIENFSFSFNSGRKFLGGMKWFRLAILSFQNLEYILQSFLAFKVPIVIILMCFSFYLPWVLLMKLSILSLCSVYSVF